MGFIYKKKLGGLHQSLFRDSSPVDLAEAKAVQDTGEGNLNDAIEGKEKEAEGGLKLSILCHPGY